MILENVMNQINPKNSQKSDANLDMIHTQNNAIFSVVEKQKTLETNLELAEEKINLIDYNSIENFKKIFEEIRDLKKENMPIKENIEEISETNKKIISQLKKVALKDEILKIEKYIDFWQPLEFVTKEKLKESQEELFHKIKKMILNFIEKKQE